MGNPVFMGWDDREAVAYKVAEHSIKRRSKTTDVYALKHQIMREKNIFRRPWLTRSEDGQRIDLIDNKPFSTEFSHTRFLVPYLMNYQGWAIFMDCDMLVRCDMQEIFALRDENFAVQVVQNVHMPSKETKMDGQIQTSYRRKNWSSFILWNCSHPANRALTWESVTAWRGSDLHQFTWLEDRQIGYLPADINWIQGVSPSHVNPRVVHFTLGGPWFEGFDCNNLLYADDWIDEYEHWQKTSNDGSNYATIPTIKYED